MEKKYSIQMLKSRIFTLAQISLLTDLTKCGRLAYEFSPLKFSSKFTSLKMNLETWIKYDDCWASWCKISLEYQRGMVLWNLSLTLCLQWVLSHLHMLCSAIYHRWTDTLAGSLLLRSCIKMGKDFICKICLDGSSYTKHIYLHHTIWDPLQLLLHWH